MGAAGGINPGGAYPLFSPSVGASGPDTGKGKTLPSLPHLCQEPSLPKEADGREQGSASSQGPWQPFGGFSKWIPRPPAWSGGIQDGWKTSSGRTW